MRHALVTLPFVLMTACATQTDPVGVRSHAIICFHTKQAVLCAPTPGGPSDALRVKIEDFYPSACLDGDADGDGIADFLDIDFIGTETGAIEADDLRCPKCNRGPGTQNDFRLELRGDEAELARGKVYVAEPGVLTVPTNEGPLTIVVTAETRIEDGDPAPGAEIRAEGTIADDGSLVATRLEVLCPAPAAMPPEEVPPEAEPTPVVP